ncbi:hypothetical protein C8R42DRAFT_717474 [Lentinula raphanica]|nr:hypothetical protein C8R42DRAFT_717474 [Lentinula raphanica]
MVSLPPELVFEIFELAAHDARESGKGLLNLTLVSHDMNNWVRSLALRFLIVTDDKGLAMDLEALHTLPPLCLEQNVKALWLVSGLPDPDVQLALERCTNIRSLAYWSFKTTAVTHMRPLIQALPFLSRLSMRFGLFISLCKEPHLNQFVHSLREISLLEVMEKDASDEVPNFSAFPNLTHFVITTNFFSQHISNMINAILQITLCKVVVLEGSFSSKEINSDASYLTDPRFCYRPGSLPEFFHRWGKLERENWKEFWNRISES